MLTVISTARGFVWASAWETLCREQLLSSPLHTCEPAAAGATTLRLGRRNRSGTHLFHPQPFLPHLTKLPVRLALTHIWFSFHSPAVHTAPHTTLCVCSAPSKHELMGLQAPQSITHLCPLIKLKSTLFSTKDYLDQDQPKQRVG